MNEADTCRKFIVPLLQAAGWDNDPHSIAEQRYFTRGRPKGKVSDDADLNITVWVKTWAEVINDARSRLRFFNKQLAYEADRDSSKNYLKKAHAKFIPPPGGLVENQNRVKPAQEGNSERSNESCS